MNLIISLLVCFFVQSVQPEGSINLSFYRRAKQPSETWKQKEEAALKKVAAGVAKLEEARKAAESFCKACAASHGQIRSAEKDIQAARKEAEECKKKDLEAQREVKARAVLGVRKAKAARKDAIKKQMANLTSEAMVQKYLGEKQNEIYASEICRAFRHKAAQTTCAKFFREVAGTTPHDPWSWLENK